VRNSSRLNYRRHPLVGWQVWSHVQLYWRPSRLAEHLIRHWVANGYVIRLPWVATWAEPEGSR
jgi:hypothetical protein